MMFIDDTIDQCASWGFSSSPEFSTRIVPLRSGREARNANWMRARHHYSVPYVNITEEGYSEILRMFYACRGQLNAFRFTDPFDNTALDDEFAIGNGFDDVFQLGKTSVAGAASYVREVFAPHAGAVVRINGTVAAVAIDPETGLVTTGAVPAVGDVLTWTGGFDVWVRFNADTIPFSRDEIQAMNGNFELLEVYP